ncbi:hypothetical protein EUGRSUZ_K00809 [Eucalyptus grandis]|uniref:peroxidase n=2 Tax=Eucalyptus grandis TaxID=71139 RepID=A0A058ZZN6_EUCGR|nr:hypothetical protein EUGRSUZ_K00809 [Eucalyptus grandis]
MGIVLGFLGNIAVSTQAQLEMGYYSKSCPEAEKIAREFNPAERDSPPNFTVRGFDFIDRVKSLVEAEYARIVSCADIIALAARDAIGGPFWRVPTVRRDGVISRASEALSNIPSPSSKLNAPQTFFANKGLDLKDLVLSSGAHTIVASHCSSFRNHLYNFTGGEDQDPSLESGYAANLKAKKCRSLSNDTIFRSDSAITTSPATKLFITQVLQGSLDNFYAQFVMAMEKMGRIDVKTGLAGEIRKHCAGE